MDGEKVTLVKSSEYLLNLEFPNQDWLLDTVDSALLKLGLSLGLRELDAAGLTAASRHACLNAITHGYDPGTQGLLSVKVSVKGREMVVQVCDNGLPFNGDLLEEAGRGGTGNDVMHGQVDKLKVKNLGTKGMMIELTKFLPTSSSVEVEEAPIAHKTDVELEYRLLQPAEALAIARCTFRTYGYTYAEEVYHPEMVAQGLEFGYLVSYGALNSEDEVVGHLAVLKEEPDSAVGELGLGMVDPRYRGHGIFQQMLGPTVQAVTEMGMTGLFAETVTVHTITQKGKHIHGWRETGVVLGYIGDRTFKDIEGGKAHDRQAIILYYATLNPSPEQTVFLPPRHRAVAEKIYAESNLQREFGTPAPPVEERGMVVVTAHPERGTAEIDVEQWGQDVNSQIACHLKDLKLKRIDLIMLNLPLSQPATGDQVESLEEMGFFFAGIIPNLIGCDVLRLQCLNNVPVDHSAIKTYSNFGGELLDYVLSCSPFAGQRTQLKGSSNS